MDMRVWMEEFAAQMEQAFPGRVAAIGLQGSHARGEATEESDIDAVLILDTLTPGDLAVYRAAAEKLPDSEKLCGFVSGKAELAAWDRADLFQFYFDTVLYRGDFSWITPPGKEDARRALKAGACAVYHACCHNALHAGSEETLRAVCKAALFAVRARIYLETGEFVAKTAALDGFLTPAEKEIARIAQEGLAGRDVLACSGDVLAWAGEHIRAAGE